MSEEEKYQRQYRSFPKPSWAPPQETFGIVWPILYVFILVVNVWVIFALVSGKISWLVALPFWLNILFNVMYTPIQFRLKNDALAIADILLVLATIIWSMVAIWSYSAWPAILFIPYLLWVGFATTLQLAITRKK